MRLVRDELAGTWTGYFKLPGDEDWTRAASATDGVDLPAINNPKLALIVEAARTETMSAQFNSFDLIIGDEQPSYQSDIGLDLTSELKGVNSSVFVRMPFELDRNPSEFEELSLSTRFDDGFRAYLNGEFIAERNAPLPPPPPAPNMSPWNATAVSTHGATAGFIPTTVIDLTNHINKLRQGQNVLAVHGLNIAADDRDFFFEAVLTGSDLVATAQQAFVNPTPATANLAPAAPTPVIEAEQGVFFNSTAVTITIPNAAPTYQIRYTIDGSEPTSESLLYSRPIVLTESAMLQARTFDTNDTPIDPSPAVGGTFIAVDESLQNRDSDIPIVLLDTLTGRLIPDASNSLTPTNVIAFEVDNSTGRASIGGSIDYLGRGGIRDRGSSTAGQPKPNLTFETWGAEGVGEDDDSDVSLLGFSSESDWVLHAPHNYDRAMIRNQFAYAISNQIGRWAPGTRAIEVYLNRADGIVSEADYMGVYVLTEKIKPGADRLDIDPVDNNDNEGENLTGGYIWKVDRPDPDAGTFTAGGQALNWVHPKSPSSRSADDDQKATPAQVNYVVNYLNEMNRSFRNGDISDPEGYSKYIDVDAWVDHHMMGVFLDDVDAFALSAYLHKPRNGKVALGPNWDFDRSMESLDDRDDDPSLWGGSGGSNFFDRGFIAQLFRDPGFWQRYVDRWTEFRRTYFSLENIDATIDKLAGEIAEAQARNFEAQVNRGVRPRTRSAYDSGKLDGTWEGEVEHMRAWLHERVRFFDSNFVQPPLLVTDGSIVPTVDPSSKQVTRTVTLTDNSVEVRGPIVTVFEDIPFVDSTPGIATVRYFAPSDNALEDTWFTRDFDDSAWQSGTAGVGYKTNGDFDEFLGTAVVEPAPDGTTIYTRFEFNVDDLSILNDRLLALSVRFDDGIVAYLNGEEIASTAMRDNELAWDSRAVTRRSSEVEEFVNFDLSDRKDLLTLGKNVLAIRLVNASATSKDLLLNAGLAARLVKEASNPAAKIYYTTDGTDPRGPDGEPSPTASVLASGEQFTVTENVRVIARNFDNVTNRGTEARIVRTDWSAPVQYDLIVSSTDLQISEINYNPAPATEDERTLGFNTDDFEFVEIHNPTDAPISLIGLHLEGGIDFDFFNASETTIGAGQYALVVANQSAFNARYGDALPVVGEYTGQLNNNGETLALAGQSHLVEVNVNDADPWPIRADGFGASLQLRPGTTTDALGKWYSWEASANLGGTPGGAGQFADSIVINEIIANTRGVDGVSDAIELFNPTDQSVDIGGWFLSDTEDNYFKFEIPANTTIPAGGFAVFEEDQTKIALSASGDSVWLTTKSADGDVDTFVDDVHFGPTRNGQSLGRVDGSLGRLVPLSARTLGQSNSAASVGSVVISELNYNPLVSDAARNAFSDITSSDLEFIELHNVTDKAVDLTGWRIEGGVEYRFADNEQLTAGQVLVLLKFDPDKPVNADLLAAFRAQYSDMPANTRLLGGYSGTLRNDGELVQIVEPVAISPDNPDVIERVLVDEALYDNLSPWPPAANGAGQSLQRIAVDQIGSVSSAFAGSIPNPGATDGALQGDFNGDKQLDVNDVNLLLAALRDDTPSSEFDLTGDGNVDGSDRDYMIETLLGSGYGDSNLEGIFDSKDLVLIFQASQYEDAIEDNSTWETGDWDGDGDFNTRDLVFAFMNSKYVAE
ncbi:MAG: CotH kinase family protein [Planctomycetales bacterium]|nr:CotH kinase family protein [Planctomycetales bacterium]